MKNKGIAPPETLKVFLTTLRSMAELFGINRIQTASHYVQLLCESVERHVYESETDITPKNREEIDRKKFIAIFRARYLESQDMEYISAVTPADSKVIGHTVKMLISRGFDVDEYLKWLFEQFLIDNPRFDPPPSIGFTCSGFVVQKFLVDNKELLKIRAEEQVRRQEFIDLINRARALIRSSTSKEEIEKIKNDIRNFKDKCIVIGELRNKIEAYEKNRESVPVVSDKQVEIPKVEV